MGAVGYSMDSKYVDALGYSADSRWGAAGYRADSKSPLLAIAGIVLLFSLYFLKIK
jgi:hypothetical protein